MKVDSVDKPTGSVDGAVKAPIDQDLVEEEEVWYTVPWAGRVLEECPSRDQCVGGQDSGRAQGRELSGGSAIGWTGIGAAEVDGIVLKGWGVGKVERVLVMEILRLSQRKMLLLGANGSHCWLEKKRNFR